MTALPPPIRPPEPTPREVAAGLRRAASLLRQRGWTRYTYMSSIGEHCAMGAISEVAGRTTTVVRFMDMSELTRRMASAAARLLSEIPYYDYRVVQACPPELREDLLLQNRLIHFNDYLAESGDEVAVLFEQAAEKIEAGL